MGLIAITIVITIIVIVIIIITIYLVRTFSHRNPHILVINNIVLFLNSLLSKSIHIRCWKWWGRRAITIIITLLITTTLLITKTNNSTTTPTLKGTY